MFIYNEILKLLKNESKIGFIQLNGAKQTSASALFCFKVDEPSGW